ncbi:MAG: hypothetical protein ACRD1E_11400, partial [Terriglobales bacterium]
MKKFRVLICTLGACSLALLVMAAAPRAPQAGPEGYHVSKTVPLPGNGGWDYLSEDPANRRLY